MRNLALVVVNWFWSSRFVQVALTGDGVAPQPRMA